MQKNTITREIKNLIWVAIGCIILVLGVNLFLTPSNVYSTGLLGLSQELSSVTNSMFNSGNLTSLFYILLNIPAILLGWFKVGKRFTFRTFFAIALISFFTAVIPNDITIIEDKLLSIITSGLFMGCGVGLTLKYGASTGGADIIALFISLFKGKSFGVYNLALNLIVIIFAIILNEDVTTGIYMLVCLYTTGVVIDKVHNSNEKLTLFIVTKNAESIRKELISNYPRGLTIFDTKGGLTQQENNTIMITIEKGELYNIIESVKKVDPNPFINIYNVERVVGYFENNYKEIL